jgi:predicted aldo/keto reductase-like oxidoreductase
MIPYNYVSTKAAEELLPLCTTMDIGAIIMKPFGGGVFNNSKIALKYVLSNKNVDIVIPGMLNTIEIEENITTGSGSYHLNAQEQSFIKQERTNLGSDFCRNCDYCQPCPQEIPIHLVLCAESLLRRMGGSLKFEELLQKAKEKVSTCTQCGECESRCPYHLPIRKLLPEKIAYLESQNKELSIR